MPADDFSGGWSKRQAMPGAAPPQQELDRSHLGQCIVTAQTTAGVRHASVTDGRAASAGGGMSDHKSAGDGSAANAPVEAATQPPFPSGPLATTLAVQTLSTAAAYSIPAVAPAVAGDVGMDDGVAGPH